MKRTPLKRTGYVKRTLPEKPTKRHPRPTGPDAHAVLKVLWRAMRVESPCCEVCGTPVVGERGVDWSIHHRRGRDGRPDSNSLQNLLLVCGGDNVTGCHGRIHQRRSESRPAGWWLSRTANEDPLMVPVLIDHESRWVYLTADGSYSDVVEGAA